VLQAMRSSAKFVFWILAIAFVGGFLLFQSSGLMGRAAVTPTTAVASVNGTDILYTDWQRRTSQLMQEEQQQAGQSLSQDEVQRIENQRWAFYAQRRRFLFFWRDAEGKYGVKGKWVAGVLDHDRIIPFAQRDLPGNMGAWISFMEAKFGLTFSISGGSQPPRAPELCQS